MSDGLQHFSSFLSITHHFSTLLSKRSPGSQKRLLKMTTSWKETASPTILARYQLKDIFNADEFGLFYEALPSKSWHFWVKRCSGGKHSKVLLTGMAASNALSEKILMFGLENLSDQDASSMSITSLADINLKRKHGWMGHFLKNCCTSSIVSSKCQEGRLL